MCKLLLNFLLFLLLGYWFWQAGTLLKQNEKSDEEYYTSRSEENIEHRVSSKWFTIKPVGLAPMIRSHLPLFIVTEICKTLSKIEFSIKSLVYWISGHFYGIYFLSPSPLNKKSYSVVCFVRRNAITYSGIVIICRM